MPRKRQKLADEPVAVVQDPVSSGSAPPPAAKPIPLPKGWAKASDVLDRVESVRTIFPDFNRAVRVGGLPVRRIHTIHGPTHGGKSAFALGLMKSFVIGGHVAAYIDAEHATPQEFAAEVMGDLAIRDNFLAKRPQSYEETIDAVDDFLKHIRAVRKDRPELCSIIVVDSINKLVPERELKNIVKDGAEEIAKGHFGRYRAALNQGWLDHLVPMLADANCALVLIAQERDDTEAWQDDAVKIKGGRALSFDASLLIRVNKAMPIFHPPDEKKEHAIVGFHHRVRIYKSKVSHMDGRHTDCGFTISNGRLTPAGFDLARDALVVGKTVGVVAEAGSWLTWKKRRWQGITRASQHLGENPDMLAELLSDVNSKIDRDAGRGVEAAAT